MTLRETFSSHIPSGTSNYCSQSSHPAIKIRNRFLKPNLQFPVFFAIDLTSYPTSYMIGIYDQLAMAGRQGRFSELIEDAPKKGPRVVTRRGIESAVVVSIEEWDALRRPNGPA